MTKKLRIAFMGTPDFVVPLFQSLLDNDACEVVCVYTQPPRAKGRKNKLEKTPIHLAGEEAGLEVCYPENFKQVDDVQLFEALNLDVVIVAAFGMLLPQSILEAPKHGCINIHPSLLPRWRGPSPVQYAIWKGDSETGVSVMSLEKGMDSGPIIAQAHYPINDEITFQELNVVLWARGTNLLNDILRDLNETDELKSEIQNEDGVTYCKLFTKEQGIVDWSNKVIEINRQIRGLNPWPGTWCLTPDQHRLKILKASLSKINSDQKIGTILDNGLVVCGDGKALQLDLVQPENKKPMDIKSALNGGYIVSGEILS